MALASAVLIVVATLVAHWPVLNAGATLFDDELYLVENPLIANPSWQSAGQILGEVLAPSTSRGYYHPLPMISLMLDVARGGSIDNLRPFHQAGLVLHALNAVLVMAMFSLLFSCGWAGIMAGVLFAVHPLAVEPIAWIAARKALLAGTFSLASLASFVAYVRAERQSAKRSWLLLSLISFVMAVLCKPTSLPLPVLMLVLDYWPLRRWRRAVVLEKLPFFAVALIGGAVAVISHRHTAELVVADHGSPLAVPLVAAYKLLFSAGKAFLPVHLSAYYPAPQSISPANPALLGAGIGLVVLAIALFVWGRRFPAILVAALFFAISMGPVLGFLKYGDRWVFTFDNYLYLPIIGLLMLVGGLVSGIGLRAEEMGGDLRDPVPVGTSPFGTTKRPARVASGVFELKKSRPSLLCGLVFALFAIVSTAGTRRYLQVWKDTEAFYRYMLTLTPDAPVLQSDLGTFLTDHGRVGEALPILERAAQIDPADARVQNNLGRALTDAGQLEDAAAHLAKALRLKTDYSEAHNNLGRVLARQGRFDEAIGHFQEAIRLRPHVAMTHCNFGNVLLDAAKPDQARAEIQEALRLSPNLPEGEYSLGLALLKAGRTAEATPRLQRALQLRPGYPEAHAGLGMALGQAGKIDEAIEHLEAALLARPGNADAHNNLGITLVQKGRMVDAVRHFEEAVRLNPIDSSARGNLERARADAGKH